MICPSPRRGVGPAAAWGLLGASSGASWTRFFVDVMEARGSVLGRVGRPGASWKPFGASWDRLGACGGRLRAVLGRPGVRSGLSWALLGSFWAVLGGWLGTIRKYILENRNKINDIRGVPAVSRRRLGAFWGASWVLLGFVLELLGGVLEALGVSWAVLGASWRALESLWGVVRPTWAVVRPTWAAVRPTWGVKKLKKGQT